MKIIADSSCDWTDDLKVELGITLVPLTIRVNGKEYVDTGREQIESFLQDIREDDQIAKSSCPSPQDFLDAFGSEEELLVVTMTSKLSGTFNSAVIARDLYLEDHPQAKVHVFDSLSGTVGESAVSYFIHSLIQHRFDYETIVKMTKAYIAELNTVFILGSLDTLVKSGRMNPFLGTVAGALNIHLMLEAIHGEIALVKKVRGVRKAKKRLVEEVIERAKRPHFHSELRHLIIGHCEAEEYALEIKATLEKEGLFSKILIVPTGLLSTTYVNEGGIVLAF